MRNLHFTKTWIRNYHWLTRWGEKDNCSREGTILECFSSYKAGLNFKDYFKDKIIFLINHTARNDNFRFYWDSRIKTKPEVVWKKYLHINAHIYTYTYIWMCVCLCMYSLYYIRHGYRLKVLTIAVSLSINWLIDFWSTVT